MMLCGVAGICTSLAVSPLWAQTAARTPTSTSCTAAKRLSVVRAWSTDRIVVAENIPQQECRFTVNDAPASAAATPRTMKAWSAVLQWNTGSQFPVEELAVVLGSASGEDTSAALLPALAQNAAQLRTCFAARTQRERFQFESAAVVCVSSREPFQGVIKVEGSPGVEFATGSPHLRLGIKGATTAFYLFLPAVQ
jgi:hypothetical protein